MNQLHFLHPLWLLALFPLALLWWFTAHSKTGSSKAWEKVIDPKLLPLLLSGSDKKHIQSESLVKWGLALIWFIATIALADPVWEKIPRPVFQTNSARVIVLDLSNSMKIADLKPSRIARARFKIEDILSKQKKEEGQIGLVLFAGDAFTASPLTRDVETIRSLVQVLDPEIMPSQGSRVDLGLKKAHDLLRQAGVNNGQVLLIADGVSKQKLALKAAKALRKDGHTISVLGVGTEIGGELPQIKYQNGDRIKVALDSEFLQEIANTGGGKYHLITTNNTDLKTVLSKRVAKADNKPKEKNEDIKSEDWKSTGPFILLLLLPLAALAFRRGWLFNIVIVASLFSLLQPQPALASPLTESISKGWNKLWINKEQQAEIALKNQQYDEAKKLSTNPLMRGTANYKKENYSKALEEFKQTNGADARYNEGNALAKLEKYKEAISAYNKALKLQPNMEDAKKNKAVVEALLKKKQEEQKKKDQEKKYSDKKSEKNNDGKKEQKDNNSQKGNKQNKKNKDGQKEQDNKDKKTSNQKGKTDKKDGKKSKNQFADANKNLDKPKAKETENSKESKKNKDEEKKKNSGNKKPDNKANDKDKKATEDSKKKTAKLDNEEQPQKGQKGTKTEAEALSKEEKMAAEQWLRRIPDDPGGLLRRKFKYQYQQRRRSINDTEQPW